MSEVDPATNESTLSSLRNLRRKLYSIPEAELNAMSPEDQVKYADALHNTSLAILKLEAAQLESVNDAFKEKEKDLESAAAALEKDTAGLKDAVQVIRVASDGLTLITNIIQLLG